jgi:hypothetical protein
LVYTQYPIDGFTLDLDLENSEDVENFEVDGELYYDDDLISIRITTNPNMNDESMDDLIGELIETVRHEIEHITQRGTYAKAGKWRRKNDKIRDKNATNPELNNKYFLLPDEVDANIHGLYAKAKTMKQPYQKVIDDYPTKKREIIIYTSAEFIDEFNKILKNQYHGNYNQHNRKNHKSQRNY